MDCPVRQFTGFVNAVYLNRTPIARFLRTVLQNESLHVSDLGLRAVCHVLRQCVSSWLTLFIRQNESGKQVWHRQGTLFGHAVGQCPCAAKSDATVHSFRYQVSRNGLGLSSLISDKSGWPSLPSLVLVAVVTSQNHCFGILLNHSATLTKFGTY